MVDQTAHILARALVRHRCDLAFGVPGGGPNLDVVGEMEACGIRFVLAHGETAACIMASVYGHLTGRLSAAVVTRGPGAASAVNGAAQATLDRHPLALITDTVPADRVAAVPHQRLDQRAMLAPATKGSATMDRSWALDDLVRFLELAMTYPAGAVHLDYDTTSAVGSASACVETARIEGGRRWAESVGIARSTGRFDRDAAPVERARTLLGRSSSPVVIVGLGAIGDRSTRSLLRALEGFGAPVLTTYQAIGAIPSEHRLAAGLFTNGRSERSLLEAADLVVTIGLDLVEPIPAVWDHPAPVVSLSPGATVDPYLPIEVELVGDPTTTAVDLLRRDRPAGGAPPGPQGWPADAGARHRLAVRAELQAGGHLKRPAGGDGRLGPLDVVELAAAASPDRLTTTVDAGAHFLAVMPFWPVEEPNRLLISNGLATMGFAVPAAIAAALARPGDPVLCFVGDGGLGMTLAELETIARLDLPITVVVFNDSALSLIRIKQQESHGGSAAVSYRQTDFAVVATGLGVAGIAVETRDELTSALSGGWRRPRLIDARIDPAPYSHLIKVTRG